MEQLEKIAVSDLGLRDYLSGTKNLNKRVTPRHLFEERYGLRNYHVKSKRNEFVEQIVHVKDSVVENPFIRRGTDNIKMNHKTTIDEKPSLQFSMIEQANSQITNGLDKNCNFWTNAYSYCIRGLDEPFKQELHYISKTKYSL